MMTTRITVDFLTYYLHQLAATFLTVKRCWLRARVHIIISAL